MRHLVHLLLSLLGRLFAKQKLNILIFHQVLPDYDPMRADEPTAQEFSWQMALLAKYFTPISLTDAVRLLQANSLPHNAVCVTFDDGYVNNLEVAAPILKQFDMPATVYIATSFSNGENMFNDRIIDLIGDKSLELFDLTAVSLGQCKVADNDDRITLYRKVIQNVKYLPIEERKTIINKLYQDNLRSEFSSKMMNESQIKSLAQLGVDIGAHTVDHPILKTLPFGEQEQQIAQSKQWLEDVIGKDVINFAYPNGRHMTDYTEKTCHIVKKLGFKSAVSTNPGVSGEDTDIYQLKRFTPWDKSPLKFHMRLFQNQIKRY